MSRVVASIGAVIGGVLLLAGCAPVAVTGWTPPVWEVSGLEVVDAMPRPVVDGVAATTPRRLRSDAAGIQARYTLLPGTGAAVASFNSAVERIVRDAADAAARARGVGYSPEAAAPGAGLAERECVTGSTGMPAPDLLADPAQGPAGGSGTAVACDVVLAAGTFFGESIRVVAGEDDAIDRDTTRILYVDTASGDVASAAKLWGEDAATALGDDLVELLRREAGALSLAAPSAPGDEQIERIRAALETTVPDGDHGFVVTIAPGFTSPELEGLGVAATTEPMHVRIPSAVAEPLLTPFGAKLLEASGTGYAGPASVPAGEEWLDCDLLACVALTYDDGPSGLTPGLLDILAQRRAAATFFMLGQSAAGNPDTVRRVAAEGHEVGNHTWNHPSLPSLTEADVRSQIDRTAAVLRPLSGQRVALFRPPYGEFTAAVLAAAGEPAILWTVDTRDWAGPSDDVLIARAVTDPNPGGIILFHDTHERSVRVAPAVIDGLRDRGFVPATVSQLFDGDLPSSGAWRAAP